MKPEDVPSVAGTLSKVIGYDAPTRTESIILNTTVEQWLDVTERRERALLPSGNQPVALTQSPVRQALAANADAAAAPMDKSLPGDPPK